MISDDYEVLDDYVSHEDCIQIPYPCIGWGWIRLFYRPADKSFFYDQYSTGYIDDCEIRYHGSESASLEQVIKSVSKEWPENEKGKRVLNEILVKDFPGTPLLDVSNKKPIEKTPEPENIHQKIWLI